MLSSLRVLLPAKVCLVVNYWQDFNFGQFTSIKIKHLLAQVSEPWPAPYVYIPRNSTVEMNCTALNETRPPIWAIDIASDAVMLPLQFTSEDEDLNAHGLFQIEEPGTPSTTVRLLINNTAANNQTVINCNRRGALATTTIFVFSRSLFWYNNRMISMYSRIGMQILVTFL